MSREMLGGGGPEPERSGPEDEVEVLDLAARDEPADVDDLGPHRRRGPLVRTAVGAGAALVLLGAGVATLRPPPASSPAAVGATGTPTPSAGWFAFSWGGTPGPAAPDGTASAPVPDDLMRWPHPGYVGTFPATPADPVPVYRITAAQGPHPDSPDVTKAGLAETANLPGSASLLVTTDAATGLDSYQIVNPPPHPTRPGALRVPATAAADLARRVLVAVGDDPTQWRVRVGARFGDGWTLELTMLLPGLDGLAARSPVAGALPHGQLTVTTTRDTPGRQRDALAVQELVLTGGYVVALDPVDVRPAEATFADVAAGQLVPLPELPVPRAATAYDAATATLALVPAPDVGPLVGDGPHLPHLLVPAWLYAPDPALQDGPAEPLLVSAVRPEVILAGVPAGEPYAANPPS